MAAMDRYQQQAVELVLGGQARTAFDLGQEPADSRERFAGISGVNGRFWPVVWSRRELLL